MVEMHKRVHNKPSMRKKIYNGQISFCKHMQTRRKTKDQQWQHTTCHNPKSSEAVKLENMINVQNICLNKSDF